MSKVVPWLLLVAGVALSMFAGVNGIQNFMSALQPAAEWSTPGSETVSLKAGNWVVFQEVPRGTGTSSTSRSDVGAAAVGMIAPVARVAPVAGGDADLLPPDALSVVGPDGKVATACVYCSGSETLTLGSTRYVGVIRFTAAVDGEYTITTEAAGADLILAPPALQTVGQTFGSLAWLGLGLLLITAAVVWLLILLIIWLSRKGQPAAPPP